MRRVFKVLMWVALGPVALVLLIGAAWVASNGPWADAAPVPVPPELQAQPVTLAPADNAFFDAQGLLAPEGETPNAWGQRSMARRAAAADAKLLTVPHGKDWECRSTQEDCVTRWRAAAATLAAQMAQARLFGERCRAFASRTGFQEPALVHVEAIPQFRPVTSCVRWLQVDAVLATDPQHARQSWAQADAVLRLLASGTQSLIGQAVTWATAVRHQVLLAQWAAQRPAGEALPAEWLAAWPARVLQPQVWMASESAYFRATISTVSKAPIEAVAPESGNPQWWGWLGRLGYLPELTRQASTAQWMADVRLFGHLEGPALARAVRGKPEPSGSWWSYVSWRNSIGHLMLVVARPMFDTYALRQADLVLAQQALQASQQLNAVPAAERAGWWARQPIDAGVRERLSLEPGALVVRTWQSETQPNEAQPLRFPLRPA